MVSFGALSIAQDYPFASSPVHSKPELQGPAKSRDGVLRQCSPPGVVTGPKLMNERFHRVDTLADLLPLASPATA